MSDNTDKRAALAEAMPSVAAIVDEYAAEFGRESFRVTFASENGRSIGRESERGFPLEKMMLCKPDSTPSSNR